MNWGKTMEFLDKVLGIKTVYDKDAHMSMPNYINVRYTMRKAECDGMAVIFLYPKTDLDAINIVKKHIERIQRDVGVPVILVLHHLAYRQREYLLRQHIPFIVDNKQIYLPFMGVYLQEKCDGEKQIAGDLLPSAQMLLLYFIYNGGRELLTSEAAIKLDLTPTSISRASRQLVEVGLLETEMRGVNKVLFSSKSLEEIFFAASEHLKNPVKRTIFAFKSEIKIALPVSGYMALSEYSMLNPPALCTYAAISLAEWEKQATTTVVDYDDQCAVELWRYDPRKLSNGSCVDRLSLALSLRNDGNERVQEAVGEMCEQVWRDINGQGN